jgi:hypothetical protein
METFAGTPKLFVLHSVTSILCRSASIDMPRIGITTERIITAMQGPYLPREAGIHRYF